VEHLSVLLAESLELLAVRPGGLYVDGTLGLGGHTRAILEQSAPGGRVIAFDKDVTALEHARTALAPFGERVRFVHADFREAPAVLREARADGILLDLGVSSPQLDAPERGFSFRAEGPLDMRMDRSSGETAADLVNRLPEEELANLIYRFGEERASRRIARRIAEARARRPFETTTELAEVVRRAAGRSRRPGLDPATRTFQALRIAVNRELEDFEETLQALAGALAPGGTLVVIAFHSLEDRPVKHTFRALAAGGGFLVLTKKAGRPSAAEAAENPRARSARLRALRRAAAA
jgi:16S rRNA (cytosine1402-N4)-methyltransferase